MILVYTEQVNSVLRVRWLASSEAISQVQKKQNGLPFQVKLLISTTIAL